MIKSALSPLSLVNQIAGLMLLLGLLGIGSMSVAAWMAQSIQGNAHAINKAGSLRMQSYRLLASVPLTKESNGYLRQMEQDQDSTDLLRAVQSEHLQSEFEALRHYWTTTLKGQIQQAQRPAQVASNVAVYVSQLDKLVTALEHKTEYHLTLISMVQRGLLAITLLLLALTIWFLRRRLLEPWQRLLAQANAVTAGDFSQRYQLMRVSSADATRAPRPHNEMDILGQSLTACRWRWNAWSTAWPSWSPIKPPICNIRIRCWISSIASAASCIPPRHWNSVWCRYWKSYKP